MKSLDFYVSSNLSEDEIRACAVVAKDVAKAAARQHRFGIMQAVVIVEALLERLRAQLEEETGGTWRVGITKTTDGQPLTVAFHEVFAVQCLGDNTFGESGLCVDVKTSQLSYEVRPGRHYVGYETTAKTLLPADEDVGEDLIYGDVIVPLETGEIV